MTYPESLTPQKKELAKRLSQCLTPELYMIHQQALDVYVEVFKRELEVLHAQRATNSAYQSDSFKDPATEASAPDNTTVIFGSDMGLFISNLYNFYQFADFQVKRSFLDLVANYILRFEKELLMSLSAFVLCIVPALDDQDVGMVARIHDILHRTELIVGTSRLYGEIWKTMLRSPRTRLTAIKYLEQKIPRSIDEAATLNPSQDGDDNTPVSAPHKRTKIYPARYNMVITGGQVVVETCDYSKTESLPDWATLEMNMLECVRANAGANMEQRHKARELDAQGERGRKAATRGLLYFYYPNRPNLVINALLSGLHSREDNLVVRATFDFLISHVEIDGDFIEKEERVRLVEGALLTLTIRDFASHKKFFNWFIGHLDDIECNVLKTDPAVESCIEAYKRILKRYKNQSRNQIY